MKRLIATAAVVVLAQTSHAAQIIGIAGYSANLTTSSGTVSFAATAPGQTTSTSTGSPTGPNFIQTALSAAATDFGPSGFSTNVAMNLTAGAGTSFNSAFADAITGVVRVTNAGGAAANFSVSSQSVLYSLQTFGPDSAGISVALYIERFNPNTLVWDVIGATSFGLSTDESNSACSPACTGGSSSYQIAANSTADIRLHSRLQGTASQAAGSASGPGASVPEPASLTLAGLGAAALLLARRRG